jgi:ParB family transcriptional regulator, chromosome partitioning protein
MSRLNRLRPGNPLAGFLESLEIKRISPSKNALRTQMGSLDELAASIDEKGLLEPIVVRPIATGFEVVAGNRRLEACKRIGMRSIPSHVVDLDDREAFEMSLVENIQHETMNAIDEASAFKKYVEDFGYGGISELAKKIGKSQGYISNRIRLLALPKGVREDVIRRRISPSVAQELVSFDGGNGDIVELIREHHLSMREVRRIVKGGHGQSLQMAEGVEPSDLDSRAPDFTEKSAQTAERAISRAVASLRMDTYRLGEVIDDVSDQWVATEILMQCRATLNGQIDNLLRFRKKILRHPANH